MTENQKEISNVIPVFNEKNWDCFLLFLVEFGEWLREEGLKHVTHRQ
jgi:hypothetical protein